VLTWVTMWPHIASGSRTDDGANESDAVSRVTRGVKALGRSLGVQVKWLPSNYLCHRNPFTDQRAILGRDGARVILDVGANVGQSVARYRWLFPDATIHSFEPVPEAFAELQQRVAGDDKVRLWPIALSDADGVVQFHSNAMTDTSSLLATRSDNADNPFMTTKAVIDVPAMTLDRFCSERQIASISILKLDVQGGEALVIAGASRVLGQQMAGVILTEVWFDPPYVGAPHFTEIDTSLRGHGYRLYGLYFGPHQYGNFPVFTADAIYVNNDTASRLDRECDGLAPDFVGRFTDRFGE
jgi:FkbM family methyltransferase